MTDTIEGDHKGRVLTRYSRTGSLDRKKRYNSKLPPDKSRAVAKSPQAKVLSPCTCVVYTEHTQHKLVYSFSG